MLAMFITTNGTSADPWPSQPQPQPTPLLVPPPRSLEEPSRAFPVVLALLPVFLPSEGE
jgi:hypothetical protein